MEARVVAGFYGKTEVMRARWQHTRRLQHPLDLWLSLMSPWWLSKYLGHMKTVPRRSIFILR